MSKLIRTAVAATLLGLGCGSALAQQGYIGASIGQSKLDADCTGTISCDRKDTAWKLLGGYMFTPNFGAELAYADLGKATAVVPFGATTINGEISGSAVVLYVVGAFPVTPEFILFGKLGVERFETKVKAWSNSGSGSVSETNTSPAYALGAEWKFTPNFGLVGEWERLEGKYAGASAKNDMLSLGVKYYFF
jgi:OOP family OmpA-OmpF porin